jgi:hypothetical protein
MSVVETSTYCATCRRQTLHHKQRVNHVLHLILSILTAGLWAVFVWLPLGAMNTSRRMRCTVCGTKPGLATVKHEIAEAFGARQPAASLPMNGEVPPSTWLPPGAREPRP